MSIYIVIVSEHYTDTNYFHVLNMEAFDNYASAIEYYNYVCYTNIDEYRKAFKLMPDLFKIQNEATKSGLIDYLILDKQTSNDFYYIEIYEKPLHSSFETALVL